MIGSIDFFTEDISFKLSDKKKIKTWIKKVILSENKYLSNLSFIFCSDDHLLSINQEYLNHDYYTDIITFDNSESSDTIEGDIFISIDRVLDNSSSQNIPFIRELLRVMIHGVLHLLGYDDHFSEDIIIIREKEDSYLSLFFDSNA